MTTRWLAAISIAITLGLGDGATAYPITRSFDVVVDEIESFPTAPLLFFSANVPLGAVGAISFTYDSQDVAVNSGGVLFAYPARWGATFGEAVYASGSLDQYPPSDHVFYVDNALTLEPDLLLGSVDSALDVLWADLANLTWRVEDQSGANFLAGRIVGAIPEPNAALLFGIGLFVARLGAKPVRPRRRRVGESRGLAAEL